jgi:hypothetical protein
MEAKSAIAGEPTTLCDVGSFDISSPDLASKAMVHNYSRFKPLLAGLLLTLAQIAIAIFILAPEGALSERYHSLIQHDSFWFMNIVDRGYQTILPPISHKVMEVSNVGFFPAYPAFASFLQTVFRLDTGIALLIAAQLAAWGFWTYFFLFCERWDLPVALRSFGALSIAAHPAAFYLIAAYSESLFLMALLGFIYWSDEEGRRARILAGLHGIVMSATRIVGVPCAVYPLLRTVFVKGWNTLHDRRSWLRNYGPAAGVAVIATLGAAVFFTYCQVRWSRWDIYMLTQSAGWNIEPDYLAVFRPSSYRWLIPALNDPTQVSQMAMTLGGLFLVVIVICELIPAIRMRTRWQARVGIYFCAAVLYYLSASGVASLDMESMLRYEFCCHTLIVLAFLHFLRQYRLPPVLLRTVAMATAAFVCAAGLSIQGWYLWNFMRGNWVA